jgi:hypothetical protein
MAASSTRPAPTASWSAYNEVTAIPEGAPWFRISHAAAGAAITGNGLPMLPPRPPKPPPRPPRIAGTPTHGSRSDQQQPTKQSGVGYRTFSLPPDERQVLAHI